MDLPTAPSGPPGKPVGDSTAHNINGQSNGHMNPPSPPPPPPPPARGDPSKARRDALKLHERPPIPLSNLCPIDKYYDAAEKVLRQFKDHLGNMELDEAYIIGRRFALFSTVSLPQHDYYKSPREELMALRFKNQKDAQWVTRGLERIVEVMDKQEIEQQKAIAERMKRQKEEEEKKRLEWEENMRQRLGAPSGLIKSDGSDLDMASKLEKLNALFPQADEDVADEVAVVPSAPPPTAPSEPSNDDQLPPLPPPMAPPLNGDQGVALLNSTLAAQNLSSQGATPWYSEEPPSYTDLFLDTLRTSATSVVTPEEELAELERLPSPVAAPKPKPAPRTPVRAIQQNCTRQLQSLQNSKHIEIIRLGTYQGRLGRSNPRFDSTNGCAVISPLVVATHVHPQHVKQPKQQLNQRLKNATTNTSQYGVSNSAINEIIDRRAPPILQTVRSKLGLNKHALIIPSDVHDYLFDEHILPQDKFVGVCGGDILNKAHTNELVTMLVNGKEDGNARGKKGARKQKVGAALFFREHVVSIVKIPLSNGACYYDLVDSLPSPKAGGMASRTRCKDLPSFEVLLRWYASSKFSDSNCKFIDDNEWDDGMCDFDPRVFQGFVWAE